MFVCCVCWCGFVFVGVFFIPAGVSLSCSCELFFLLVCIRLVDNVSKRHKMKHMVERGRRERCSREKYWNNMRKSKNEKRRLSQLPFKIELQNYPANIDKANAMTALTAAEIVQQ